MHRVVQQLRLAVALDDRVGDTEGDPLGLGDEVADAVAAALGVDESVDDGDSLWLGDWDGVRVGVRPEVTL